MVNPDDVCGVSVVVRPITPIFTPFPIVITLDLLALGRNLVTD